MPDEGLRSIGIAGLGLIGGSIASGLKARLPECKVIAWDSDRLALEQGIQLGVVDDAVKDARALSDADLVVLAVPVQAMGIIAGAIDFDRTVVTDVGSVKGHVIDQVITAKGQVPASFVPGHPIAGSERHGVMAADGNLFERHQVILTPVQETDESSVKLVTRLWELLGARVVIMMPDHHDIVLAQTSHLPHLLAYGLVDTLASSDDSLEVFEYAAGGFRDFSRIAASDPVMWRDIYLANQAAVIEVLDQFTAELQTLRGLIQSGDGEALREIFVRAKQARDHFSMILRDRMETRTEND